MWCHGPRALSQAHLALCGVGPHRREGHLSCCPIPTSCFLHYSDTRAEKGEQEGEKGLSAGYQRWLFLASSFLKTYNLLCSVLQETKLGLGQEWAESLESSVDRNSGHTLQAPTTFPTPRIIFPSLSPHFIPSKALGKSSIFLSKCPSLTRPYP